MAKNHDTLTLLSDLVAKTMRNGADAADAVLFDSVGLSVTRRLGEPESIERDESNALGLRVFIGKKQAFVSSTDFTEDTLYTLAERAVSMAKASPEDPFTTLADNSLLVKDIPTLDLYDTNEPTPEQLNRMAQEAEEAARAIKGVTNSEGADASYSSRNLALVTSNGFAQSYKTSSASVSVSVLAGKGTEMERDYDYAIARHVTDLEDPKTLGENAGSRAVKRLNPKKIQSCTVPVVFDPRIAKGLVSTFASAINGAAIARRTSFLKDNMNDTIFNPSINIIDDPHRIRGLGSRPFDSEGVGGEKRSLIENGVLTTWLLDLRSANQLGLTTTGHASRGIASPPSPSSSNLYMENGTVSCKDLLHDIQSGFYVTDTFGMGINTTTGDYSQGANGFWIENGEITYPVSEVTIAGHLGNMFKNITPANDLTFRYGTNAPTLRVDSMTVAGS